MLQSRIYYSYSWHLIIGLLGYSSNYIAASTIGTIMYCTMHLCSDPVENSLLGCWATHSFTCKSS
eukprot:CCRYP_015905-RA/>CCRYP_015905-RA protein AED:0.24 eAED:0.24 QI:824/1/1/1/0/0/2/141/64